MLPSPPTSSPAAGWATSWAKIASDSQYVEPLSGEVPFECRFTATGPELDQNPSSYQTEMVTDGTFCPPTSIVAKLVSLIRMIGGVGNCANQIFTAC
jgi:hypothetical protein